MAERLCLILCLVALATAAALSWLPWLYLQSDIFWLIETGRLIVTTGQVPAVDIYSFTRSGAPWVVYQWLFEVVVGRLDSLYGLTAVSLVAVVALGLFLFLFLPRRLTARGAEPLMAFAVPFVAAWAMMPDLVALRPQLVTFMLLSGVYFVLTDSVSASGRDCARKLIWLLPLALLWANVHLSFVILPMLVLLYATAALFARADLRPPPGPYAAAFLATILISLANPHGLGLYRFVWQSLTDNNITPELRPLDLSANLLIDGFIVVACLSYWRLRRERPAAELAAALGFLAAGLSGARFILYFVIWSIPAVSEFLSRLWRQRANGPGLERLGRGVRAALFSPLYALALTVGVSLPPLLSPLVFPGNVPVRAADFLADHRPAGRIFCGEHAGSYLIYRFAGKLPVFIDTRADLYGRRFCERYRQAVLYADDWEELLNSYEIEWALIPNRYRLSGEMRRSGKWTVSYADDGYVILRKRKAD